MKKDWYFLYILHQEPLSNEKIILSKSLEIMIRREWRGNNDQTIFDNQIFSFFVALLTVN